MSGARCRKNHIYINWLRLMWQHEAGGRSAMVPAEKPGVHLWRFGQGLSVKLLNPFDFDPQVYLICITIMCSVFGWFSIRILKLCKDETFMLEIRFLERLINIPELRWGLWLLVSFGMTNNCVTLLSSSLHRSCLPSRRPSAKPSNLCEGAELWQGSFCRRPPCLQVSCTLLKEQPAFLK